jgi:type IV secretory pathway VirB9-like protein
MVTKFYKIFIVSQILNIALISTSFANIIDIMKSNRANYSSIDDKRKKPAEKSLKEKALFDKKLKKNIELIYDKKKTYRIRVSTHITTNLVLPRDEKIISYNFGDNLNFVGNHNINIPNILSINTLENGLYTNLTIITEKQKIYNFTLESIPDDKWQVPHYTIYMLKNKKELMEIEFEEERKEKEKVNTKKSFNFGYKIKSSNWFLSDDEEKMIPKTVYDDGKFTYIKFSDTKRIPGIYQVVDGNDEVVNFKIENDLAIIETVSNTGFSLKNGDITICIRKINDD